MLNNVSSPILVRPALGVATSVRIGQLLGLARPRLAKLAAILLGFALSLIFSVAFWIWRKEWSYLFNDDEDVAEMVAIVPSVRWKCRNHWWSFEGQGQTRSFAIVTDGPTVSTMCSLSVYRAFKDIGLPESLPDHSVVTQHSTPVGIPSHTLTITSFPNPC
ncbi:uncharacterized protein C8R40DRAFT_1171831 [Lentinula edodes]|uniref:uncharacterized protein n=1 Tax=Lentinula edodes TaxID=5353 RepID=UPI001E8D1F91|nr:uncharacterized protein C8R40DRAFT_1171831 [Lentinula edodes]KAH7873909.1 hypothetical protein C8R40DRAFT_1171831 [Lentinula edodes]